MSAGLLIFTFTRPVRCSPMAPMQPMTYIFDAEPVRWKQLLATLGVDPASVDVS
jgi:hypothetical protein